MRKRADGKLLVRGQRAPKMLDVSKLSYDDRKRILERSKEEAAREAKKLTKLKDKDLKVPTDDQRFITAPHAGGHPKQSQEGDIIMARKQTEEATANDAAEVTSANSAEAQGEATSNSAEAQGEATSNSAEGTAAEGKAKIQRLNEAQVARIRELRNTPKADDPSKCAYTHKSAAELCTVEFGFTVTPGTISQVARNRSYKDPNYIPTYDGHQDIGNRAEYQAKKAEEKAAKEAAKAAADAAKAEAAQADADAAEDAGAEGSEAA